MARSAQCIALKTESAEHLLLGAMLQAQVQVEPQIDHPSQREIGKLGYRALLERAFTQGLQQVGQVGAHRAVQSQHRLMAKEVFHGELGALQRRVEELCGDYFARERAPGEFNIATDLGGQRPLLRVVQGDIFHHEAGLEDAFTVIEGKARERSAQHELTPFDGAGLKHGAQPFIAMRVHHLQWHERWHAREIACAQGHLQIDFHAKRGTRRRRFAQRPTHTQWQIIHQTLQVDPQGSDRARPELPAQRSGQGRQRERLNEVVLVINIECRVIEHDRPAMAIGDEPRGEVV